MRRASAVLGLCGVLCASARTAGAQPATAQDPDALAREILAELVAARTTEAGATTPAANALAARFRAAGFPAADVIVAGPNARNRNLVVRWRGRTRARPYLFAAHLDVVDAPRLEWSTDPWRLTEREGHLYGRGVLDDKGPAAAISAALILARRSGRVPERDLMFVFSAGEESGVDNGIQWLLKNRRSLVDAERVLVLDAGGGDMVNGVVKAYAMQSAEKIYLDLELVAAGPGGHSSAPPDTSPIDRLARAMLRVNAYRFPVRLNPVVRAFFERRVKLVPAGPVRDAMAALVTDRDDVGAQSVLLQHPDTRNLLRTTCVTTMLRGGSAPNAIPQEVGATVNCRLLPGDTQEGTVAALQRAIADSSVHLRILTPALASDASVPTPEFVQSIERVVHAVSPGTPVVPYMENGATDGVHFRNAGMPAFGVNGFFIDSETFDRMHGRDERIPVPAFKTLVLYSQHLIAEIGRFAPPPGTAK